MGDPWTRHPKGTRELIFARDDYHCRIRLPGCKHKEGCYRCAEVLDHIIPALAGGRYHDPTNLRAACHHCNQKRKRRSGPKPTTPKPQRIYPERW